MLDTNKIFCIQKISEKNGNIMDQYGTRASYRVKRAYKSVRKHPHPLERPRRRWENNIKGICCTDGTSSGRYPIQA
jgi:hypothetical protein